MLTRPPRIPTNLEAEQALLGAVLYDNGALERLSEQLQAGHFFEPFHQRLFAAMTDHIGKGLRAEPIAMLEVFRDDPAFGELGGLRYLADLVDRAPAAAHAAGFGRLVHEVALRRDLIRLGSEIADGAAAESSSPAAEMIALAERGLAQLAEQTDTAEAWTCAGDLISGAIASAKARDGHMDAISGLHVVDDLVGGFAKSEVTIIAGRPGMAKSLVASQIAKANARRGQGVAFFSQEMGREPLGLRLACDLAYDRMATRNMGRSDNPTFDAARKARLTSDQWHRLGQAAEEVSDWPLWFDVRPGLSVAQIEAASRRAFRRWRQKGIEPGCIVIDHLGIIRPPADRQGSRHAEVADVSRSLAAMAKRLDVPVVVLCQLNRAVETRGDDKRPQLADLRQAGEIEEDARCVIFLLRPAYYLRPPEDPKAETPDQRVERETKLDRVRDQLLWIVAKNNNGQLGQAETFIDVACAAIRDREAS